MYIFFFIYIYIKHIIIVKKNKIKINKKVIYKSDM